MARLREGGEGGRAGGGGEEAGASSSGAKHRTNTHRLTGVCDVGLSLWVRGAGRSGAGGPPRCSITYAKCGDAIVEQVEQRIRLGGHGSSFLVLFDQLGVEHLFLGGARGREG